MNVQPVATNNKCIEEHLRVNALVKLKQRHLSEMRKVRNKVLISEFQAQNLFCCKQLYLIPDR